MHISRRKHERSRAPACRRGLSNSLSGTRVRLGGISRPASTGYNKPDGMWVQKRWCPTGSSIRVITFKFLIDLRSTG